MTRFAEIATHSCLGNQLNADDQRYVLSAFVHRFTRDHRPRWSESQMPDGKPYPVQFASDAAWLAHTEFAITKSGLVNRRIKHCRSCPTWPDNPELRRRPELSNLDSSRAATAI